MKRYLLSLAAAIVCSVSVWAVIASPEPFEYTRPDGTKVMARIYGDEFHSYIESLDGELLYGSRDKEALEQASERRRAHRIQKLAGYTVFPTKGSPHSIVLLVGFSDKPFGESQQDFQDLLNKSGYDYNGANGSCRDYYIASSDSIFAPIFDCYGPYTLSRPLSYYGGDQGDKIDVNAPEMVAEACQLAHEAGVNFKDYDTNNDGLLDNVFIFCAGNNQAEGADASCIWPHQSDISHKNVRLDGVLVGSYACTPEYRGRDTKIRCGVGTFCHEFGHVIGQPDFYDTKYNYYSISDWDVMCSGSHNNDGNTPPTFSAYERMYEGWLIPKQLELPGRYSLSVVPFKTEAYLIAAEPHNLSGKNPNPSEFFLLENRNSNNVWDTYLPGHGMLVWHIDYSSTAWTSNSPNNGPTIMRYHLEEANGVGWKKRMNGEKGRASDPYPGTNEVTSFLPTLHNGTQLAQPIFNIEEVGGIVSFTYISDGGTLLRMSRDMIEVTTTLNDNNKIVSWEPQMFELLGTGLDPEQPITVKVNGSHFKIYAGEEPPTRTSSFWTTTLTLYANADSTLQQPIWVNFSPKEKSCTATSASILVSASNASLSLPLKGYSPRHTYVTTPEVMPTSEVTPYSFTMNWKAVEDAECYYFTLYQMSDGETTYVQDFENFDTYDKIHESGWQSNTNLTTTSDKKDGTRALYFKNYGDQITSETYPTPVTKMSFWYNAFISDIDTIGVLVIEMYDNEKWSLLENKVLTNKAKRETATYEFQEEDNIRAFRITWLDNGGSGIAFDAFTAVTSKNISYIHKGRDASYIPYEITPTYSYTFTSLDPSATYYYQIQCTDVGRGCEEHLTSLSEPVKITTIEGKPIDGKQLTMAIDSINYSPAQHAIYLLSPKTGDYLYFFDTGGHLVQKVALSNNVCIYPLDLKRFTRGEVYMVQHAVQGKLGRKNKWLKFVF